MSTQYTPPTYGLPHPTHGLPLHHVMRQAVAETTQAIFAARYGVHQSAVSLWCSGRRIPRTSILARIIWDHPHLGTQFMRALGYRRPFVPTDRHFLSR